MQGTTDESGDSGNGGNRQPASVLAAWIRELLADVDAVQARKLDQLRSRLQTELFAWDHAELADALHTLNASGRELHFAELRPGWFARALGRHRPAFERFAAAVQRMVEGGELARKRWLALAAGYKDHNSAARRVLVELDLECRELGTEMDQGVTWLHQMCEDINAERASGRGDDRQLAKLAEGAQSYTLAFKRLQAIGSQVRDIGVRAHGVLERRAALLEQVRAEADAFEKNWVRHVGDLAAEVKAGRTALPGIPKAIEAHDEAMKRIEAALDACGALQGEEHLVAQQLEQLRETLAGR